MSTWNPGGPTQCVIARKFKFSKNRPTLGIWPRQGVPIVGHPKLRLVLAKNTLCEPVWRIAFCELC